MHSTMFSESLVDKEMLWWKATAMVEAKDRKFPFSSLSLSFLIQKVERGRIGVRIWGNNRCCAN